jgi:hypothetical protein
VSINKIRNTLTNQYITLYTDGDWDYLLINIRDKLELGFYELLSQEEI